MKPTFILLLISLLQGCVFTSSHSEIKPEDSIQLHQDLTIPGNEGRVYIQNGTVTRPSAIDYYYPHCWFISWKIMDVHQVIKKDLFIIAEVIETTELVKLNTDNISFASLSINIGSSTVEYNTEMSLFSRLNPEIRKLICSHWEDPNDANHLSRNQIQKVLGGIASLQ